MKLTWHCNKALGTGTDYTKSLVTRCTLATSQIKFTILMSRITKVAISMLLGLVPNMCLAWYLSCDQRYD
jgi:hypothetical protein